MRTLYQCLLDLVPSHLQAISRFWDVELPAGPRRDRTMHLAATMADADAIAVVWGALSDNERRALQALRSSEAAVPSRTFARRWGTIRTMGPARMEREEPWREPISPAEGLWYKGFVCRAFEQTANGTYEAVFVPQELKSHLPVPPSPAPEPALGPTAPPPISPAEPDALLDDICTLISFIQNSRVHSDAVVGLRPRDVVSLVPRLRSSDGARLDLMMHLLRSMGWVRTTDGGYVGLNPGPVTAWLESAAGQQRESLADAWLGCLSWTELRHVPTLRADETGTWSTNPLLARRAVLHHLARCEPSSWYLIQDLVETIKRSDPDFQRPDGDYDAWYIRDAASGSYLTGFESWDAVEGALIRFLIVAPLSWLGLVRPGASIAGSPPTVFSLTPAGSEYLGLSESLPTPEAEAISIQADFTIQAPASRRFERFQLERVADWVRTGDPFAYRVSPSSLDRAARHGIDLARVLTFLQEASRAPIPKPIVEALNRWQSRGSEARLESVGLLRMSSPELMTQVAESPLTRGLLGERIGPAVAVVRRRNWPKLVAALGRLSILPDVADLER